MTVQPAEPTETRTDTTGWYAVAAVLAWVVYFSSLVATYLIAFSQHSLACERAAGWGMSISLALALAGFLIILGPAGMRWARAGRQWHADSAVACALLVAASVAVIWIAMNLTVSDQPAGAWLLTVPAAAAPLGLLAAFGLTRRPLPEVLPSAPPAVPEVLPEAVPQVSSAVVPAPEVVPQAQPAVHPASPAVRQAPPIAPPALPDLPPALPDLPPALPDLPPAPPAPPVQLPPVQLPPIKPGAGVRDRHRVVGLLNPRWASRLGSTTQGVVLDSAFWQMTLRELGSRDTEQGGVALMVRSDDVLVVFCMVFPVQLRATSVYCEFSTDDVMRVRRALDQVSTEIGLEDGDITVTWVHTHPHMGPFLSGTDRETARNWRALDPDFTPIVLDAFGRSLERQIGVFDATGNEIAPVAVIDGLVDESATPLLISALQRGYRADGLPDPQVLISGAEGRRQSGHAAGRRGNR